MHGSHTGEYIGDTFLGMLDNWKISQDCLVLRDSEANIVNGAQMF